MDQEYGKLIVKFFDKEKQKFVIPFGSQTAVFDKGIVNIAKFNIRMRQAHDTAIFWASSERKGTHPRVWAEAAPMIGEKYLEYCAGIAIEYITTKGIYDLSERDFLNSKGGENLCNSKNETAQKHDSPLTILSDAIEKTKTSLDELAKVDDPSVEALANLQLLNITNAMKTATEIIKKDAFMIAGEEQYIDDTVQKKCSAILSNLEKGRIPVESREQAFCQVFQMNPFIPELYKIYDNLFNTNKDEYLLRFFMMERIYHRYLEVLNTSYDGAPKSEIDRMYDRLVTDMSILEKIGTDKMYDTAEKNIGKAKAEDTPSSHTLAESNPPVDENPERHVKKQAASLESMIAILQKYEIGGVYIVGKGKKSSEKISKAVNAYGSHIPKGEKIIACYDDTLFGNAEDGCILTVGGICIHNTWSDTIYFPYSKIENISLRDDNIYINSEKMFSSMMGKEGRHRFCELLKNLVNESGTISEELMDDNNATIEADKKGVNLAALENSIICKNCGQELSPDSCFCTSCGTPV